MPRIPRPRRRTKYARRKRHLDYLSWLRTLPCAVCGATPSDPAHVGNRGLGQLCDDLEAIPLCAPHHRREYPQSHHTLGKQFWVKFSLDKQALISELNRIWALLQDETGK